MLKRLVHIATIRLAVYISTNYKDGFNISLNINVSFSRDLNRAFPKGDRILIIMNIIKI
jgi:hypothetical protein